MVTEKSNFSSNAKHNFAKGKVICKCKSDKPWKKINKKGVSPLLLRRPFPAPYFHPLFLNVQIIPLPTSGGGNQNLLLPLKKGGMVVRTMKVLIHSSR